MSKLIVITVNGDVKLATTNEEYAEMTAWALEKDGHDPVLARLEIHPDLEETWL